jgi:hypothetical protein
VAEWFKAAVLKTARGRKVPRGFESHPFRHKLDISMGFPASGASVFQFRPHSGSIASLSKYTKVPDQDLFEVAEELRLIARERDRWIKMASAYPFSPAVRHVRGINKTDWIQIDCATYASRDEARA